MDKAEERSILEQFLQSLPDAPAGTVEEGEGPDFVLRTEARRIGIELTGLWEFRSGLNAREMLSQRQLLLDRGRAEAQRRGLPPLHISMVFSGEVVIPTKRIKPLASKLVDLVSERLPAPGGSRELRQSYAPNSALPLEVETVWIDRPTNGGNHFWTHIETGFARSECSDEIQARINHKASRRRSYASRCDTCWLVVHCAELPGVSMFMPSPEAIARTYLSPFSRTFFFGQCSRALIELRTAP